ncbi:hypothetical protein PRK78_006837 [Emydomyces testavorans]|uniref:Uncharacterized protein n=1 Tax=Emydomyces testavorans TaxID=2070801 RepID=A0AAF0IM65_9EURO|nr:hypothetical protein PRK78_006837 [Emydomyces testavorans]
MGLYTNAFPFSISWYPDTTTIYLPGDGPVALNSRDELGEATAKMMLRDPRTFSFQNDIVLLTASRTYTFTVLVHAICQATREEIQIETVSQEEFPHILTAKDAKDGKGKKLEQFRAAWLVLLNAITQGEAQTVDPLMRELWEENHGMPFSMLCGWSGRERPPTTGGYTWHQNYTRC